MSMSTYVMGLRDLSGKLKEMLDIKKFCDSKKVSYPKEVDSYFGEYAKESEKCIIDTFHTIDLEHTECVKQYKDESDGDGFEIEVSKIPKDIETIRFYNSY